MFLITIIIIVIIVMNICMFEVVLQRNSIYIHLVPFTYIYIYIYIYIYYRN